jgi:hypothetical protein
MESVMYLISKLIKDKGYDDFDQWASENNFTFTASNPHAREIAGDTYIFCNVVMHVNGCLGDTWVLDVKVREQPGPQGRDTGIQCVEIATVIAVTLTEAARDPEWRRHNIRILGDYH